MDIEAEQKHVPQLWKDLGLTKSDIVKNLRRMLSANEAETIEKGRQMTQLKRAAKYFERVPRKALQYTARDASEAHLEVHVGSDWAGRHSNASEHVWSDYAVRTTHAQAQLNS